MQAASLRKDARVIGLVSLAHGVSHFYHLILAALFPFIKPEFGLSYAQLGLLMTMFFVVSGIGQALAGFVVDRVGARRVLFAGLALLGVAALVLAGARSYAMLAFGAMLAGMGNAVFHPADYTLLNQLVSKQRIAHAVSMHGISGSFGWAAAPVFLAGIAAVAGWRSALVAGAAIPFLTLALLFVQRHLLQAPAAPVPAAGAQEGSALGFLKLPAVWMSFTFFFLIAVALGGVQSFAVSTLVTLYGVSLASATTAYTAYMLCSALGMLAGGFLAARTAAHQNTIAVALCATAAMALLLALAVVPRPMALLLMGAIGFGAGVAGPARDLLIRAAAPANATGRVFGIVYAGLDSGLALGPVLFGALLDHGHPAWVFGGIALFQLLAVVTALGVGGRSRAPLPQKA